MSESVAEEIARLKLEIAERQARLTFLVLGDPAKCVSIPNGPISIFDIAALQKLRKNAGY